MCANELGFFNEGWRDLRRQIKIVAAYSPLVDFSDFVYVNDAPLEEQFEHGHSMLVGQIFEVVGSVRIQVLIQGLILRDVSPIHQLWLVNLFVQLFHHDLPDHVDLIPPERLEFLIVLPIFQGIIFSIRFAYKVEAIDFLFDP